MKNLREEDKVEIDYFDRITNQWIKIEVSKDIANFIREDNFSFYKQTKQYEYFNIPYDEFFKLESNSKFLLDNNLDIDKVLEEREKNSILETDIEQKRTLIQNALLELTARQREVIEMRMYENLTYSEIARKLGCSKQGVRNIAYSGIKKIKKYIEK